MSLALLVIDVQRGLFETSPPPADAEDVIAGINALARRARSCCTCTVSYTHLTLPTILLV